MPPPCLPEQPGWSNRLLGHLQLAELLLLDQQIASWCWITTVDVCLTGLQQTAVTGLHL